MEWIQSYWLKTCLEFIKSSQPRSVFELELIVVREGFISFRIQGSTNKLKAFTDEAGGHRWQRTPPTEKGDRVHSSTITVAVLTEPTDIQINLHPKDIEEQFVRGSGAGGQHRNKTESCVVLKHIPTNTIVRIESERSQKQNREIAYALMKAKLFEQMKFKQNQERHNYRKEQVGSGMRGDKVRTIQVKHNRVINHLNGKEISYKEYCKGNIKDLWNNKNSKNSKNS